MEVEHVKANQVPIQKKRKSSRKVSGGKRKRSREESDESQPKRKDVLNIQEINKLLSKEIVRLRAKNSRLKAQRPRREKKDPTPKQLQQWALFASKVSKAKKIYYAQAERSNAAWSKAMSEANQQEDSDSEMADPDQVLALLAESGMDPSDKSE